jgi:predicted metal-dependent hydrolase
MTVRPDQLEFAKGVALFNCARYFEAHEVLEDIWRAVGWEQPARRHWQGLVQLAVAFHHQSTGNFVGARSVLERALRNLHGGERTFPALDLDRLRTDLAAWREFLDAANLKATKSQRPGRHTTPLLPKIMTRGAGR